MTRTASRRSSSAHANERVYYLEVGVDEYWIVDAERREVHVVAPGITDVVATERLCWMPRGTDAALEIELAALFVGF